jgi:ribonuclease P protein component
VIWESEAGKQEAELVPRVNRQLSKATQRNRIKRILREFFRHHRGKFVHGRWVFIAKSRVERVPNNEIFADLETLFSKVP